MKVALTCSRYFPHIGGVETHVQELSERLVKKGFEVDVLTTDFTGELPKEEIINGVPVKRFKSFAPGEAYYFSRGLSKYLRKVSGEFDIVHAHSYHAFPSLYAARAKDRNKLVLTPHYHGTGHTPLRALLIRPYRLIGKRIFKEADKIICVSNHEKNLLFQHFRIDEEKTVVIPNGLNLAEFKDLKKMKKNFKIILYVGRLEKYKGVHHLIGVLPRLSHDVRLRIIGKGSYKDNLVRLIRKLGIEDRVEFYQDLTRHELLQKYADADVFVLLSKHEAFGISVAEALASKTPCIVAKTSALAEWVDNQNCFGVDYPVEIKTLASLICDVIGKKVKQVKLWDWDEVATKTVELYNDVTSAK
jgi:glycosyltransferase involved in cell wall biosynthesis